MNRIWPIIAVQDVQASSRWYRSLLDGSRNTHPAGSVFDQVLDADGTVLLCMHQWGDHDHPSLSSADIAQPGNGLLLFFRVDDFDEVLERAQAMVTRFEEEPHRNPNTGTMEFSLRDLDGYHVTISDAAPP